MTALDYQVKNKKSQAIFLFLTITLITLFASQPFITHAKDKCEEIDDLDDRAACYAEKIEEKEEEKESITKKLEELRNKKDSIIANINDLASQLTVTKQELQELANQIAQLSAELEIINQNLEDRRKQLAEKYKIRNTAVRNYAKKSNFTDLQMFFGLKIKESEETNLTSFEYAAFDEIFHKIINDENLKLIKMLNIEIATFEKNKKEAEELKAELESAHQELATITAQLESEKRIAEEEKAEVAEEESEKEEKLESLEEEIQKLSEKQQAILQQKYGEGYVSGYEAASYELPDPPFKPAFAAMSYGAYTHYKGMSQYGAKGRANDGKDYKDILEFYYGKRPDEKDDFPDRLCVEGYGEMDFDDYLYGIAEMPSDWPMDALKAQAIAARSYAYRYAKQGKCICTTQSCQVFSQSKSNNPPDRWKEAVDETEDKIIEDVVTYYSATTGGYIENIGWDLDGSTWPKDAYEKKANSPWFYKAWYTQSYYDDSGTCGRSTPWLSEDEMADILNSWVVWRKGSSDEKDHISPITTSCWGGDPYSHDKMADKADKYADEFNDVDKVWVDIGNNGQTQVVHFETNNGRVDIDGQEFKTVFNLRAPAYVAIRSRLFDIEYED